VEFSTCDWPGRLVATAFCQGCPWSCPYCHNPALRDPRAPATLPWSDLTDLVRRRRGLLDGVVLSGGEPTVHLRFPTAARELKDLGTGVGLHTCGALPGRLEAALGALDWVGLDIKAPRRLYRQLTGSGTAADRAFDSLRLLRGSGVDHEVRTTLDLRLDEESLFELAEELLAEGVTAFTLQALRSQDGRTVLRRPSDLSAALLDRWRGSFRTLVLRE
jgi:pyruvate formate lyase activating enzyme